jgi:hypothetical protein
MQIDTGERERERREKREERRERREKREEREEGRTTSCACMCWDVGFVLFFVLFPKADRTVLNCVESINPMKVTSNTHPANGILCVPGLDRCGLQFHSQIQM